MEWNLSFRYNAMEVASIDTFKNIKGGVHENCKDVYFIRLLGYYQELVYDVLHMDDLLGERMQEGKSAYKRIKELPKLVSMEEVNFYAECYKNWIESGKRKIQTRNSNGLLNDMLGKACKETVNLYRRENIQVNDAIEKNFVVKLLYWFDFVIDGFIIPWNEKISVKIVAENIIKKQEYLFFYMLTLVGFDVLLIQNEQDIKEEEDKLNLSKKYVIGSYSNCELPAYHIEKYKESKKKDRKSNTISSLILEQRNGHKKCLKEEQKGIVLEERREKSFEELALLAASVVLIIIHGNDGEPIGSGSGIMVGRDGYILTNNHVLSHGRFYTVRIENDEQVYKTDEVIKYHSNLDLAVIRINHKLHPIPVYTGEKKLVRGQRVVAIGSPLGLFNSVSDGIISGFRVMNDIDMIQFTAPISQGSSGGAVLNMYGEVIGISTAGIDSGQNINLAVGYECINNFIQGFKGR